MGGTKANYVGGMIVTTSWILRRINFHVHWILDAVLDWENELRFVYYCTC